MNLGKRSDVSLSKLTKGDVDEQNRNLKSSRY